MKQKGSRLFPARAVVSFASLKTLSGSLTLPVAGLVATSAGPPAGYYDNAQGKAGSELRDALHAIIYF